MTLGGHEKKSTKNDENNTPPPCTTLCSMIWYGLELGSHLVLAINGIVKVEHLCSCSFGFICASRPPAQPERDISIKIWKFYNKCHAFQACTFAAQISPIFWITLFYFSQIKTHGAGAWRGQTHSQKWFYPANLNYCESWQPASVLCGKQNWTEKIFEKKNISLLKIKSKNF